IDFSTPMMSKLKSAYEAHAFHGKHYTIPWVVGPNAIMFYNIEMFEDVYLDLDGDGKKGDTPYSMYEKGTWTWENFLKTAKEMTVTDKNGKVMTYGLASRAWTDHLLMYITGESIVKTSGNKLVSNLDSSNFQRIYNDYAALIMDSKVVSRGGDADSYGVFDKGSAAMLLAPSHCASGNYFSKIWKSQNVGIAPIPKDGQSSTYYVPGSAVSFYVMLGGFEAKESGKVNRDLLNAFIHASLVSENEKSDPNSEAYKKTREEFVAKWSKENKKFTNAWYDEWCALQKSIGTNGGKITPWVDPYNASIDVNGALLEKMLGLTCPSPITYSAAANEAVGLLNAVLATVND
ncbi:MAG: extracellular solute-binding protein, partial [Clostridia bacterium]|nr:extracellular solute-binding protein [Clostridia bacterium]